MSSAKSAPTTLSSDLRDQLVDSATRVCETSFFAFVEPASGELFAAAAAEEHWFHSSVDYSGPSSGRVWLSLPEELSRDMLAAFLGFSDPSAANQAEIEDVVGEFANRVCGAWLTALGGESCFALTHPEVTYGGLPALADGAIVLAVNDRPVVIRAELA